MSNDLLLILFRLQAVLAGCLFDVAQETLKNSKLEGSTSVTVGTYSRVLHLTKTSDSKASELEQKHHELCRNEPEGVAPACAKSRSP